jgi:ADP-ribosylglycohydrolase
MNDRARGCLTGAGASRDAAALARSLAAARRYSADAAAVEYAVGTARQMRRDAATFNGSGRDAGALARIAPLAVFCALGGSSAQELAHHARQDALLSHPSPECQGANVAYCAAIYHLLRTPGDSTGAQAAALSACDDAAVRGWIQRDDPSGVAEGCGRALCLAFAHLRRRSRYDEAVGDARADGVHGVVGGLIGALWGSRAVPASVADADLLALLKN